eukprot:TRINITY_DN3211_c0_g1_i1.p1 TRINITY_DN3211_c0_g1~~TRINITY_DN3211_c0_g1_i1.p1  ORF type:complete len:136 (+),score=49.58 TRINITY_DN3211_c0_g1_i1:95-502(+)
MADVTDPNIAEAYKAVRNDADETNWLVVGYETNKKLVLQAKGSGGMDELVSNLKEDSCNFAYTKVVSKDEETTRAKFVFITWIGENASVMRKGNMSVHVANIKSVIRDYTLELKASEKSDLSDDAILSAVKKVNY